MSVYKDPTGENATKKKSDTNSSGNANTVDRSIVQAITPSESEQTQQERTKDVSWLLAQYQFK